MSEPPYQQEPQAVSSVPTDPPETTKTGQNNVSSNDAHIEPAASNMAEKASAEPLGPSANGEAKPRENQIISSNPKTPNTDEGSKSSGKKAIKTTKKGIKLDAKSKLEKSRQSARECRARKKLRYQYLEDLVSNREKAVVKLREELSMFCELSKQIEVGTLAEKDKLLLLDQTKENGRTESANLL